MNTQKIAVGLLLGLTCAGNGDAALPPGYLGTPFDDTAYRAEQQAESIGNAELRQSFTPSLVVWDAKTTARGAGWVAQGESGASIALDGTIHYHKKGSFGYSAFGWNWAAPQEPPVDVQKFDAISFLIKITGPKPVQELYFALSERNPAPVSLRQQDPNFADGSWHRITIPVSAFKWSLQTPASDKTEIRGLVLLTHLWQESDYDVYLDHVTWDRSSAAAPLTIKPAAAAPAKESHACKAQVIPGRIECAFFDVGGEGISYHDTDPINVLSGVLNQQKDHQRPQATPYHWNFRMHEGVDISYTKDFADFNHNQNMVTPATNQLYIGAASDGEWCNYTVDVRKAGTYKIVAMYGNEAKPFKFSINNKPACVCKFPVHTGSMHKWNKAEVGTITFAEAGLQLLTFHYDSGNNFAYFEFEEIQK